jgi:hypothetical protein
MLAGGVTSDHGWDNIENAFKWASYFAAKKAIIDEISRRRFRRMPARAICPCLDVEDLLAKKRATSARTSLACV